MAVLATQFWNDEYGVVLSAEIVIILTVGILSMIVGLQVTTQAVVCEFNDLAIAFTCLRQTYSFAGFTGRGGLWKTKSWVQGSAFADGLPNNQLASHTTAIGTGTGTVSAGPFITGQEIVPSDTPVNTVIEAPTIIEPPGPAILPQEPGMLLQPGLDADCERLRSLVRQLCEEVSGDRGMPVQGTTPSIREQSLPLPPTQQPTLVPEQIIPLPDPPIK